MKINFRKVDKGILSPEYKTSGAAAFDVRAREDTVIESGELGYIPLNIAIEIPRGYFGILTARSSTHKLGLMPANGIGIFDSDFSGNNDVGSFIVLNYTKEKVFVEKGTRIAQILIAKLENVELNEVEALDNKDRGGIGSTGFK